MDKLWAKGKKPLLFSLCLLPIALASGIFAGFYQLDLYSEEMTAMLLFQLGSTEAFVAVCAVQAVVYALFCSFFGVILADKAGLWKPIRLEKKKLISTLIASAIGGILLSLDYWTFGNVLDGVQSATASGLTVSGILASILYGGIIEEVMMRLFFLSLLAFLIWKVFCRKYDRENIPEGVFVAANIVAAMAFAAGHIQANVGIFGQLTPLVVFRCFLLNGGGGLLFGWLYRKYGILYSMTSHAAFHIVSKLIWVLFI